MKPSCLSTMCSECLSWSLFSTVAEVLTQETGDEVGCRIGQGSLLIRPSLTKPLMALEKPCETEQELNWITMNKTQRDTGRNTQISFLWFQCVWISQTAQRQKISCFDFYVSLIWTCLDSQGHTFTHLTFLFMTNCYQWHFLFLIEWKVWVIPKCTHTAELNVPRGLLFNFYCGPDCLIMIGPKQSCDMPKTGQKTCFERPQWLWPLTTKL